MLHRFSLSLLDVHITGRNIMGQLAAEIFRSELPSLAKQLVYVSHDANELDLYVKSIEDQETLRELVRSAGLFHARRSLSSCSMMTSIQVYQRLWPMAHSSREQAGLQICLYATRAL